MAPAERTHSRFTVSKKYQTFRQVAWTGSFEGGITLGLVVRAQLPFKVSTLPDPLQRPVAGVLSGCCYSRG